MQVVQVDTLDAYIARLRHDPEEVTLLFRDLLIGVTNFFRDAKAFAALEKIVIPGCSPASARRTPSRLGAGLRHRRGGLFDRHPVARAHGPGSRSRAKLQIFATDIDEAALAVARSGRYPETLLEGVSKARLGRFFTAEGTSYVVDKPIRDMVRLLLAQRRARSAVLAHGPDLLPQPADLPRRELQGHVMPVFHYALKPGGFLFLGTSENIAQHADLFAPLDKKHRIFERREDGVGPATADLFGPTAVRAAEGARGTAGAALRQGRGALLERYAAGPCVVNSDGDIVHSSAEPANTWRPAGGPSRQLLAMARKGLRSICAAPLQRSRAAPGQSRPALGRTRGPLRASRWTSSRCGKAPTALPVCSMVLSPIDGGR